MKAAVIYHDADFDGKLSRDVCLFQLNYEECDAHPYGWDYGRPLPECRLKDWSEYDRIYIVDLSVDELMARPELHEKIIWIDHHKSAIEKWDRKSEVSPGPGLFSGIRIDGVAACRLCWQWFLDSEIAPDKAAFVERKVSEPRILQLAGEYDIWDHRDDATKPLQFGLRALDEKELRRLVDAQFKHKGVGVFLLDEAIKAGRKIMDYVQRQQDEYSAAYSQTILWEGVTFCALNIAQRGNSDLLKGGLKPEHQACFAWRWTGADVMVSLYHAPGHTDLDLSQIAVKHGGGGHRGACGFRMSLADLEEILTGGTSATPPQRRRRKNVAAEPPTPQPEGTEPESKPQTEGGAQ